MKVIETDIPGLIIIEPKLVGDPRGFFLETFQAERYRPWGINRPFVLNVGGYDERKNLWALIDGFARVPEAHRSGLQLGLTFTVLPHDRDRLLRHADAAGVRDALVVTGEVNDTALRVLYQRCTAFVFPSLYEGFGLPILEAMQCGAAVVAGNNSSQVEVVGTAGREHRPIGTEG